MSMSSLACLLPRAPCLRAQLVAAAIAYSARTHRFLYPLLSPAFCIESVASSVLYTILGLDLLPVSTEPLAVGEAAF